MIPLGVLAGCGRVPPCGRVGLSGSALRSGPSRCALGLRLPSLAQPSARQGLALLITIFIGIR